jgi:hypothetical protein
MFRNFDNFIGRKAPQKDGPLIPESFFDGSPLRGGPSERKQVFAKVFRWRLPDGHIREPASVEVVGSFTHWQKVPLMRDSAVDAWHVTLHHIPGHRTHHYMLLVDGQPAYDRNNDGLAVPHGPEEERYQIMTDKGPRVFMLFAQTK